MRAHPALRLRRHRLLRRRAARDALPLPRTARHTAPPSADGERCRAPPPSDFVSRICIAVRRRCSALRLCSAAQAAAAPRCRCSPAKAVPPSSAGASPPASPASHVGAIAAARLLPNVTRSAARDTTASRWLTRF
jgi:hypothetical protein